MNCAQKGFRRFSVTKFGKNNEKTLRHCRRQRTVDERVVSTGKCGRNQLSSEDMIWLFRSDQVVSHGRRPDSRLIQSSV